MALHPPPLPQLLLVTKGQSSSLLCFQRNARKGKDRTGQDRTGMGREGEGRGGEGRGGEGREGKGREGKGREGKGRKDHTPAGINLMRSQLSYRAAQAKASSPVCGVAAHRTAGECRWHSASPQPAPSGGASYAQIPRRYASLTTVMRCPQAEARDQRHPRSLCTAYAPLPGLLEPIRPHTPGCAVLG